MLITPEYREINRKLHEDKKLYGTSGHLYADFVEELCVAVKSQDVLDYGCGKRTLEHALCRPIHNYDPSVPGFDARPEPADIVACTDVLEHVEPECLDDVLRDIWSLCKEVALFGVHLTPALKHLPDGRNAHLILKPTEWWAEKISERFHMKRKIRFDDSAAMFIACPRKDMNLMIGDPNLIVIGESLVGNFETQEKTLEIL